MTAVLAAPPPVPGVVDGQKPLTPRDALILCLALCLFFGAVWLWSVWVERRRLRQVAKAMTLPPIPDHKRVPPLPTGGARS